MGKSTAACITIKAIALEHTTSCNNKRTIIASITTAVAAIARHDKHDPEC